MKDFIQEEDSDEHIHSIKEMKANIMKETIKTLKEPYRSVIEMREIQKMSYKDIADVKGINLSTIKSQIRNSRAILIKSTEEDFRRIDELYL